MIINLLPSMMLRVSMPFLFLTMSLGTQAFELGHALDLGRHGSPPLNALSKRSEIGVDEILKKFSEKENRKLPRMVNAEIRLDKTVAKPGKHFIQQYTLLNALTAASNRTRFETMLLPDLKNAMCSDQTVSMLLKNGVSVTYQYQSQDAEPIGSIELAPSACA